MKKTTVTTIDEYLSELAPQESKELQRLRDIVKKEVPEAEESISYEMPAFKYKNEPLIYFAAFKNHLSIFPTPGPIEELAEQLKPYESGKGTLKYRLEESFPEELFKKLIRARLKQIG